jgi:cholesterol oxidase
MGGDYVDNPAYDHFRQVLTAHPLGGCPMGANRDEGVVDSFGEIFDYPNLYVTDGAMLPGPVGPNPALTIAALADRAATHIVEKRGGVQ